MEKFKFTIMLLPASIVFLSKYVSLIMAYLGGKKWFKNYFELDLHVLFGQNFLYYSNFPMFLCHFLIFILHYLV